MKSRFAGLTDVGQVRAVNQDYYFVDPEGRFFIVADGMGGHAGGQEASKIATDAIRIYLEEHWESSQDSATLLREAITQANQSILDDQLAHPERSEMGTTAVIVMNRQEQYWYGHVGDSRLYRSSASGLEQVTQDHTWVARALEMGQISQDQAKMHPLRHVLLQCLGRQDLYRIDVDPIELQSGDRLLLCSDGLSGEVSDDEIQTYLQTTSHCEEAANVLVDAANQGGGADNITVVVVEVG